MALITQPFTIANAVVTSFDLVLSNSKKTMFYQESGDANYAISNTVLAGNNAPVKMDIIKPSNSPTVPPTQTSFDIRPVVGDFNLNPAVCNSGCPFAVVGTNWDFYTRDLWCGVNSCFTFIISTNSSYPHQLIRITTIGSNRIIDGYMNISSSNPPDSVMTGYDQTGIGTGGITVFIVVKCSANSERQLLHVGATQILGIGHTEGNCAGGMLNDLVAVTAIASNSYDGNRLNKRLLIMYGSCPAGSCGKSYSPSTFAFTGLTSGNGFVGATVLTYMGGKGTSADATSNDRFAFGAVGSSNYYITSTGPDSGYVYTITASAGQGTTACVNFNTGCFVDSAKSGCSSEIRALDFDVVGNKTYVYCSSTQTLSKMVRMYWSSPNYDDKIDEYQGNFAGQEPDSMAIDNEHHTVIVGYVNAQAKFFILEGFTQAPSGPTTVCIDTNGDTTTDVCFTDTNGDGVPDAGPAGALGAQRSNANITSFGAQIYCAFGISADACTNKDARTNGVGLMYLFLIIIFSYAVLVTIHHEAQKYLGGKDVQVMDALKINPLLLVIMLIVDIGFTWYLHWISDIIFYTMVAVMAGITTFGIYRQVKGGSE